MVNVRRHLLYESFPHSAQKFYILSIPLITLFLFSITHEFTDGNSEPFCQMLTHQETTAEQQRSYLARCSFSIWPGMKFYRALLKNCHGLFLPCQSDEYECNVFGDNIIHIWALSLRSQHKQSFHKHCVCERGASLYSKA